MVIFLEKWVGKQHVLVYEDTKQRSCSEADPS